MALVFVGFFYLSGDLDLDETIREGVEIGQVVVLVVFLDFIVGPYLHELFDQLLDLAAVPTFGELDITYCQFRHFYFLLVIYLLLGILLRPLSSIKGQKQGALS